MHPHSKEGRRLAVDPDIVERSHHELLSSFLPSGTKTKERMIHSYNKVIDGFAATLDEDEVEKLKKHHHVISVFESEIMQPQTTRSWDFLGFEHNEVIAEESLWQKTNFGEDLIIANLDTGVWPEARSFSDENYGPIPKRFKGECENENDAGFRCNKKLIGARYFYEGCADTMKTSKNETFNATKSPRDDNCHGTHTLATAAGNFVKGANFRGFGNGTAKGGAPRARVAAYKVCWSECGCVTSDVMAAFESAITDGVDIISFSMGGGSQDRSVDYFKNGNAVASFFAVKHGVLVVASAGNVGDLGPSTVTNISPWFLTVGAGSSDRDFSCRATLGDKRTFRGDSITNITTLPNSFYPLITGSQAVLPGANSTRSLLCTPGSLDPMKVKGKILVCQHTLSDGIDKDGRAEAAGEAGAVGLILANDEHNPFATLIYFNPIPVSHMSYPDGQAVFDYIKSTKDPIASLTSPALTELGVKPAPVMGYFSSRGPNNLTAAILKPDLIAPGINILAAWSEHPKAFMTPTPFKFSTGTSMATPHVAGIAALLKKLHPQWSPSAIKSALMTTATNVDNTGKPIREMNMSEATPFAYGSGQVIDSYEHVHAAIDSTIDNVKKLYKVRTEMRAAMQALLKEDGILVLPTVADPPMNRNSRKGFFAEFYDRILLLCSISSMSGCCQVTVPLGEHDGFPTSVSFIAFHGADKFLLDTILDCYTSLREQASLASDSVPVALADSEMDASELLKEKGNAAYKGRQWNKAVNYYTEAIKLNKTNATLYSNRAAAYLELGCFRQAEEDCTKAISLDKKNVKAYLRRGTAKESLLQYKEAAEDFKHALVLEPHNKVANLGEKRLRKLVS